MSQVDQQAGADAGAELHCPECGYDLRGIESDRCPECGADADRAGLRAVKLLWPNRRRIGRVRAYLRTWWTATFRIARLADEVDHPVGLRDALRFRWITVAIAAAPILTVLALVHVALTGQRGLLQDVGQTIMAIIGEGPGWLYLLGATGSLAITAVAMVVTLVLATGVGGWFLHPASLPMKWQNRAAALGNYLCAPLALLTPALFLSSIQFWNIVYPTGGVLGDRAPSLALLVRWMILLAALAFTIGPIVLVWLNTLCFMRLATMASIPRVALAGVLLPVIWAALAIGCVTGLHVAVMLFVLIVRNLVP